MKQYKNQGHLLALLTIFIWGTTFISTKILLVDFKAVEILFFRFLLGLFILFLICPKRFKSKGIKEEKLFAVAGLCGICLYYLLENIALTYTSATNVGIIISMAPFFTGIASKFFLKEEKLTKNFFFGFITAIIGILLITYQDSNHFSLNPIGDLLALLASAVWAMYSILTKKISALGYPTLLTTRRVFMYGILFMIPFVMMMDFHLQLDRFTDITNLGNMLFLGLGASALCFVTWNRALKLLGALKTSTYIYLVPIITMITSIIVLHENLTWMIIFGTLLTLCGLILSKKG